MGTSQSHKRSLAFACGIALAGTLGLGACSTYEAAHPGNPISQAHNLDAAKAALTTNEDFNGHLGRDYYAVASRRAADKDWVDSDYFARKSVAASEGENVLPERSQTGAAPPPLPAARAGEEGELAQHARNWLVPGNADPNIGDVKVLDDAHQALVAALDGGGRTRFPSLAARSQALYDCWVERSENDVSTAFNGQCRRGFVRDYTDLIVLLDPPAPRNVYFAFNSAKLTPEGEQQIKDAVAQIEEGTAHLAIVGKADRSGSNAYNMKLSDERAKAVSEAAIADGLPADRISVTAVGETQPPVRTKDGVREPRNRLVEIETVLPAAQVADLSPQ